MKDCVFCQLIDTFSTTRILSVGLAGEDEECAVIEP